MGALRVHVSSSAAGRLAVARDLIAGCVPGARVLVVGASRGAADDLARSVALGARATFGIQRLSLTQLAARSAILTLAREGMAPSTRLGAEAVAARVAFDATRAQSLRYFAAVADTPGFARAVARTVQDLRLAGVAGSRLASLPLAGQDLANLLERFEEVFAEAASVDRARLFRTAAQALRDTVPADTVVLLDLSLDHPAERELVDAVVAGAARTLATVPQGDHAALEYFQTRGAAIERAALPEAGDLGCLRRFLFTTETLPRQRELDGSLELFSAPGEGRESIEIARRILKEAARGVPFDEMAVFVRSTHSYFGLLEHAMRRAGVPAWFDRGTRRPHPTGRAFLALLACAAEQLSASRFAEYLSLGQVPAADAGGTGRAWAGSRDETFDRHLTSPDASQPATADQGPLSLDEAEAERQALAAESPRESDAVVAGTLRAPWRWEHFLVESAVIGGDPSRWARRLSGMAREIERRIDEEARHEDGSEGARARALEQTAEQLKNLQAFALPIVETLAAWPRQATWGEWLDRFEGLAPRVLRLPAVVLRVLADLRPMAEVGPIDLDEARRVLGERLLLVETEPPARRFGRVFVGTPQQARGRSFRVVFVPGLAERMFPQKPREDPLLLDDLRAAADGALATQRQRLEVERLLLQLAAGAASERLFVSYPRIELSEARARVPSFYALDVMRAATGRVPDHEVLEERARLAGNATLAWPAPPDPAAAIDDQEHDLAVLRRLLDEPDRAAVRGHAHYLLKLNECLRRSVVDRWARGERRWSPSDGLTRVTPHIQAALSAERLTARSFSLSSLQRFSACPYQFLLAAVYRLHPLDRPEPLQRMDPLARGSIFHEIQARFFNTLKGDGALPLTSAGLEHARAALDRAIESIAEKMHDELAPAVERVWNDEIATIRRDLHTWIEQVARDGEEWSPTYFEFAFGPVPGERDASSIATDVIIDGRFRLRGAIDLIEEHRATKLLRITDHKTGRKPDRIEKVVVDGGAVLQPVLYGMAIEAALGRLVYNSRLFYCTSTGSFYEHQIPLNDRTRSAALEVLQVIDRAIETGFLAAAPTEEACGRCDFRCVCGPDVFRRVSRKPQNTLADLQAIRSRA
jgi:CRISPR/Cas system-associated exonuclease Cas4 (RecB family)